MKISARNVFQATITSIKEGPISAEVELSLPGGETIVAGITEGSVQSLGLAVGASVLAIVKAPQVLLVTDSSGWRFSARNQLPGTVASVQKGAVNASVVVTLAAGAALTSIVTHRAVEEMGLAAGMPVTALFKAGAVILGRQA